MIPYEYSSQLLFQLLFILFTNIATRFIQRYVAKICLVFTIKLLPKFRSMFVFVLSRLFPLILTDDGVFETSLNFTNEVRHYNTF